MVSPAAWGQSCVTSNGNWQAFALTAVQTGQFTVTFDATPNAAKIDSIITLAPARPTTYGNNAVIVRFNSSGLIDARNGGSYQAASSIPYIPNGMYHFRVEVDATAHRYSVFVIPALGPLMLASEIQQYTTVGSNFAFRSEQATASSLGWWSVESDIPSATVCNFTLVGAPPPVNGTCGTVNGVPVLVAPTANLCSLGAPSAVFGTGPWNWSCAGTNGGTTAQCSAPVLIPPPPPPPAIPTCTSASVTINGTNFQPGISVTLGAMGTVLAVTTLSATQVTATAPCSLLALANHIPPPPPVHSALLSWIASTTPNVQYRIWRGLLSGTETLLTSALVNNITYTDLLVLPGATYFYWVTAIDPSNQAESLPSNEVSGTIPTP